MRTDAPSHAARLRRSLGGSAIAAGLIVAIAVTPAADAVAQDALGSGDLLDANLSKQGRRNTPRPIEDFRQRSLVVTGNVAAGRGFRGEVGYGAERDFRGSLGSDDLFDFRADSILSSVTYVSGRRTLNTLDLGQQAALFSVNRSGVASTLNSLGGDSRVERPSVDRLNLIDRAAELASSRTFIEVAGDANIVTEAVDADGGVVYITSSPLRGLQFGSTETYASARGVTAYDLALLREALENRVDVTPPGTPFAPSFLDLDPASQSPSPRRLTGGSDEEPTEAEAAAEAARVDTRVKASQEPDYAAIMERVAQRYADRDDVNLSVQASLLNQLDEEFGSLRAALLDATARRAAPDLSAPGLTPGEEAEAETPDAPPGETPDETPDVLAPPRPAPRPIEDYGILLRHGQTVDRLAATTDTRFGQLITEAQDLMQQGEYFRAERLFTRALRFTPNHPFAQVGLSHTQIGAGFYLSASLTLQQVFALFPEMIDVRYADGLLPLPLRRQEAIEQLRVRIGQREARDQLGFLLAYLGHQQRDRGLVQEGLDAMRRGVTDTTFVDLLEGVWLGVDAPPADPAPAPAPGPGSDAPDK